MNPFKQDAAAAIKKWNPIIETEDGEFLLYIDGVKVDPTIEELELINSKALELKEAAKKVQYKELRASEYRQLNQFELMFNDQQNSTTTWVDAINAIKAKYPK